MPAFRNSDECLQHVKSASRVLSILGKSVSKDILQLRSATLPPLPDIQLPQAPSIATILKTHCIKHSRARELTRSYERHVSDLRRCTEAQIQLLMEHYQDNVVSFALLEKQVTRYISLYESGIERWRTLLANEIKAGRSEFNTERIPLLITYFKHNAYPSTHDRIWLAHETGNTPQQIGIWNRRRRSRKTGMELKRASPDEIPHNLFTEGPEARPPHTLPTHSVRRPRMSSPKVTAVEKVPLVCSSLPGTLTLRLHERLQTNLDSADSKIPPYPAYQRPATSSCWLTPNEFRFPEPDWDRKPAPRRDARVVRSGNVSVDDLNSMMAVKLRLFCGHPPASPVSDTPWHTMLYTYPSPSPLPALIRSAQPNFTANASAPSPIKPSLKRKRSEINEERPPFRSKHSRSHSTSSYSSLTSEDCRSSDYSSCNSSSSGPQTPPSALLSLPLLPRFVDWSKFSIPTIPQAYGLY